MIYAIGIGITFLLVFILLNKKEKSVADKLLLGWLCVILVHLGLFALFTSREYIRFPYLLGLDIPLPLLHGPFLFLYTSALTHGRAPTRKMLIHFIPYALAFVAMIPFLLSSPHHKINTYQNEGQGYEALTWLIFIGIIFSGITYTILSVRSLISFERKIKDGYSYTEKINLQWLLILIIGLSSIWIFVFFADDEIIFSSVVFYVLSIGFFGIKQVGIFTDQLPAQRSSPSEATEQVKLNGISPQNAKYETSALSEDQLEALHRELVQLMRTKKVYLIPELTLTRVSEEIDVHPNTLSQVINRVEKKNFFDYINTLRVEEFKKRVGQPENQKYTLLALAYECGFNSKTSFNRNFKNLTGKSPTQYLKELK